MNLGMVLLAEGRLEEGWHLYRGRVQQAAARLPAGPRLPEWKGDDLAGRRILLWPEQGHGDCVQFIRYAKVLKERGAAKVIAGAPTILGDVLASALGVDEVGSVWKAMTSLTAGPRYLDVPGFVGTKLDSIPAALP